MKKLLSAILAMVLALSMITGVAAEGTANTTYDCENGYTAIKLSNPGTSAGEVDGLVNFEGVNDRGQSYSWSSVGYGDWVYVGTCFGAIYQTLQIIAIENGMDFAQMKLLIDTLYNGDLYNGDPDKDRTPARSFIVKINTKTYETVIVDGPVKIGGFRAATKMNNKLYFAATGATPYLLEIDPEQNDATQVVCYSETPQSASISTGIRGLTVYKNMLVATMIGNNGAYMVASENPSEGPDSFKTICTQEDLLDYPAYHYMDSIFGGSIWDIIEFNDKLYITVVTGKNGNKQAFALFSGEPDENGQWSFDLIAGDEAHGAEYPFGLGSDRSGAANLMVHDGYLYIGGYNDPMVALPQVLNMEFESLYKDLSSPVCLWRLDTDENIEMVAGDANEVFPEGPSGNMGAGFGSNLNQYVWRMESYNGKLYVGTFDIGSLTYPLMQFTNGDILKMDKEDFAKQMDYINQLLDTMKPETPAATDDQASADEASYAALSELGANIPAALFAYTAAILSESADATVDESGDFDDFVDCKEKYYNALVSLRELYNKVKDRLSAESRAYFDKLLNNEKIKNYKYFIQCCRYLSKGQRGFDLLVSEDGVNFDVITRDGFGDPYNHGCRVFAITDSGLCIGTANPFYGAQVWLLDDGEDVEETSPTETEPSENPTTAPATTPSEPSENPTTAPATQPESSTSTEPSTAPDENLLGDVNLDKKVNIKDTTAIQKHIAFIQALSEEGLKVADFNKDSKLNIKDATAIQKFLAKLDF